MTHELEDHSSNHWILNGFFLGHMLLSNEISSGDTYKGPKATILPYLFQHSTSLPTHCH
jgi:type IV secretory pathway TrbF-like protein